VDPWGGSVKALVTGGAQRVGRAISEALADAGFDVAIHCHRSTEEAARLGVDLRARGVDAITVAGNLATVEGCAAVTSAVVEAWGGVDVLVHNAASYRESAFGEISADTFDATMALNCRAALLLAQGLAEGLRTSTLPGGGLILHITDIAAEQPEPGYTAYCVSKAALNQLTRSLAVELAPDIRVNAIAPGTVLPPETLSESASDAIRSTIPQGRFGVPTDVASLAVFLATGAPHVTGQVWSVDGGRSIAGALTRGRS
jgi:pteridine reductase